MANKAKTPAANADTATLEHPDSTRDQRAIIQTAPPAIAFKEVQTPSAHKVTTESGGEITAYAKTTTNINGSEVTEAECPDGHEKGEVASGTVGKTATCGKCAKLLVPTTLLNEATGEPITFKKNKAGARVAVENAGTADKATPKGGKGVTVEDEKPAAAPKAKKATKSARSASKSTSKASKPKSTAGAGA